MCSYVLHDNAVVDRVVIGTIDSYLQKRDDTGVTLSGPGLVTLLKPLLMTSRYPRDLVVLSAIVHDL